MRAHETLREAAAFARHVAEGRESREEFVREAATALYRATADCLRALETARLGL
jgi:hypothetical protein